MELSISHSSVRVSSINNRLRPFLNQKYQKCSQPNIIKFTNLLFPSKCSTNKLMNYMPLGLYGDKGKFLKSLSYGQHYYKRATIKASAQVDSTDSDTALSKLERFGSACYTFTRPYSMNRALLSAICLFARVFVENPQLFTWSRLIVAFPGLIAIFLARSYGHGLNQIFDADIDRINKPYLPIPAGDISLKQAWFLVISELIASLVILWLMKADLITTSFAFLSIFFATFYSAPPFRFKANSVATAMVLPLISVVLNNIGITYATRASIGLPFSWSAPVVFITTFATFFFIVISIMKDISDIEGDMKHNIRTFPAIFGCRNATLFSTGILLVNYIGAIMAGIFMPQAFKWYLMVPVHAILALWLLFQARKLDKENYSQEASADFYQCLWNLINLEYLLFIFM